MNCVQLQGFPIDSHNIHANWMYEKRAVYRANKISLLDFTPDAMTGFVISMWFNSHLWLLLLNGVVHAEQIGLFVNNPLGPIADLFRATNVPVYLSLGSHVRQRTDINLLVLPLSET